MVVERMLVKLVRNTRRGRWGRRVPQMPHATRHWALSCHPSTIFFYMHFDITYDAISAPNKRACDCNPLATRCAPKHISNSEQRIRVSSNTLNYYNSCDKLIMPSFAPMSKSIYSYLNPCPNLNTGFSVSNGTSSLLAATASSLLGRSNGSLPSGPLPSTPNTTSRKASGLVP
jgi:hypothetical protein